MRVPVPEYLHDLVEELRGDDGGSPSPLFEEIASADPDLLAVALTTVEGRTYSAGDDEAEFSIQSISKPFAYAAALADRGAETVLTKVGVEPSGEAFNELSLEEGTKRPKNPMINVGALVVHHLLVGPEASMQQKIDRAVDFFSALAGRRLSVDQEVYETEIRGAERNLAIAHMLRSYGVVEEDAHDVVAGYTAQCAVRVTVRDLSVMGSVLANAGVHPVSGERVIDPSAARQTLSVMAAAGMYDASGGWLMEVGIPAKSGISGGMLGALPGQVGIGALSPRLDEKGNSVRGIQLCRRLSADMGLHLMEAEAFGATALRSVTEEDERTTVALQGVVQFNGAEAVLHHLNHAQPATDEVVIDLNRVHSITDVGQRMMMEGIRRLQHAGHTVVLHDPDTRLPADEVKDAGVRTR